MPKFIQLIVQEKAPGDFRGFIICQDKNKVKWEIRGYENSVLAAADDCMNKFKECVTDDHLPDFGYVV